MNAPDLPPELTQARALVYAFLDQTPKTRIFMRACALLVEGRQEAHQERTVRFALRALCRHGYAYALAPDVWFLTALGTTARDSYRAVQAAAKELAR